LDGRVFLANLDRSVARRVDLPDILSIPPYQFTLFHPVEPEPEPAVEAPPEGTPAPRKTRAQIASHILSLFRKHPKEGPVKAPLAPENAPTEEPPADKEP
jgi:hypothetical protein